MARLTSGTFKYTRRVKPGDPNEYNAPFREATAEISWSADEDEAIPSAIAAADLARTEAIRHVHEMLGGKRPEVQQTSAVEPKTSAPPAEAEPEPQSETFRTDDDDPMNEDDPGRPEAQEITDKELVEAVTRKNAERLARPEGSKMKDGRDARSPSVIKELVGNYVKLPKTSRDIPQELRPKFLKELKEL